VVANVVALAHHSNDVTAKGGRQCIRDELASKQVREHATEWEVDTKGVGDLRPSERLQHVRNDVNANSYGDPPCGSCRGSWENLAKLNIWKAPYKKRQETDAEDQAGDYRWPFIARDLVRN
jgi:hypothetical protein